MEKDSAAGTTKTNTYVYDELNQLTHISGSDGSKSDYTYYATGLRASKNINGSTAVFTYDGTKLLMEQTAGQTKTNIHGTNLLATAGSDVLYSKKQIQLFIIKWTSQKQALFCKLAEQVCRSYTTSITTMVMSSAFLIRRELLRTNTTMMHLVSIPIR